MMHGIIAWAAMAGVNSVSMPLTYDELYGDNLNILTRTTPGSYITNDGFKGNGASSLLSGSYCPSWMSGSSVYMQATITALLPSRNTIQNRDVVVSFGGTSPKMQFAVFRDPANSSWLNIGFRGRNVSTDVNVPMVRRDWRYEGRYPQLVDATKKARPQAIAFNVSDDGYTAVAHYEDVDSIFHVVDSSGALIGSYRAGYSSHYSSLARDQSGRLWTIDYATAIIRRIDEAASISSGTLTTDFTYNVSTITGAGGVEFITYSGVNYLLVVQYLTSGTPYIYAIAVSGMVNGATFALANRFKRFSIQWRCQGMAVQSFTSTTMYMSSNRLNAETDYGRMYTFNIATSMAGTDGAAITILNTYQAPTRYPEDIDFDSNNRLWTLTEGSASVGDSDAFLSLWSTNNFNPQENTYSAYYDGATITTKVNNKLFDSFAFSSSVTVENISIGGPYQAVADPGWVNGFFSGTVKNVYIADTSATDIVYNSVVSGSLEPNSLTVVNLTIVNPGAESGVTGWTNEVGALATRNASPAPYEGAAYFSGGSNAQTIASQSVDLLTATGLTQLQLDAKDVWCNLNYYQASFGGTDDDVAAMGLALANGGSETSRNYDQLVELVPNLEWVGRSFASDVSTGDNAVKLIYRADRFSGTNLDGYIDAITCKVYLR